ncbi:MAG: sensor histidine kinase [Mycobacteriales bacterium]
MPPTGSRAARDAFERLMARCAVGLRVGAAVAVGVAASVGLAAPASPLPVAVAVVLGTVWAGVYAAVLLRHWRPWPVGLDVGVAAVLCLGHGWLVPAAVAADATSWVFLIASTTVIVSQLSPWPVLGLAATAVVPGAYVGGLVLAPAASPPGAAVLLLAQGALVAALMTVLRRAVRAADLAVAQREAAERESAVRAARRAEEREHFRMLHDSVSATLTVVAAGGLPGSSPVLRAQARRDLHVVERLHTPAPERHGDLGRWLAPVLDGAGPDLVSESTVADADVPAEVGGALAGAVTEALANVVRHAGPARVRVHAGPADGGGVTVEVADDGVGFEPTEVPASRRGVRESLVGRMRSVGGTATVSSVPGLGTRVVLRWPAEPDRAQPDGTQPDRTEPDRRTAGLGEVIAVRYRHGFALAVILLVGAWHVGNDLVATVTNAGTYRSVAVEVLAWLTLGAAGAAGAVRLLRRRTDRAGAWSLAAVALVASAAGTAAVPGPAVFGGANWTWGAAGWFGALILLRRPPAELVGFVLANSAVTLAVLAHDGALDRVGVARFATVLYGTAALQLTVLLAARALDATARRAAAVAEAEAEVRRHREIADELHTGRRDRYRSVHRSVAPLLSGLAGGELDPADREVRHRCAVEASRLRRLFAETDDVADPLLHELRACSYIADQRGVLVDLQVLGRLPGLDRTVRRVLTEAPLLALAGAERYARVTVVGRSDEVAVSVLVDDCGPGGAAGPVPVPDPAVTVTVLGAAGRRWVEARWRR